MPMSSLSIPYVLGSTLTERQRLIAQARARQAYARRMNFDIHPGKPMRRREFITLLGGAVGQLAARGASAAERSVPTIGILWHAGSVEEEAIFLTQIQQGLQALGYSEGRNITLVNTFANEQYERFNNNAVELVRRKVDVLVAVTLPAALAAQRATNTIPIVFILVTDPVASKLVASFARPGGNITGLSPLSEDLLSKNLELFKEIVPRLSKIELMINPTYDHVTTERSVGQVRTAAERLGIGIQSIEAARPDQIEWAFSSNQDGVNGVMVQPDSMFFNERKRIAELGLKRKIPTLVFASSMVEDGGLMTYSANVQAIFRRSATYIDKILKGAKPDELPVEQPTQFDFVINLNTAKVLGLTIPPNLLAITDGVIE
jgi:putative tryptophan/tyrosine transport system substrate-binding protein